MAFKISFPTRRDRIAPVVVLAVSAAVLVLPGSAGAQQFCVPAPCSFGTAEPSLSGALSASNGNGGAVTDQIQIAPGTYTETSNPSDDASNPVEIYGAGAGRTTITRSAGAGTIALLVSAPTSTVHDLTIRVGPGGTPSSINTGLLLRGVARRIEVAASGVSNAVGISALSDLATSAVVEDALVTIGDGSGSEGISASSFGTTVDLRLRHVTVVGSGAGPGIASLAHPEAGTPGTTNVTVSGAIVRGFAQSLLRSGTASPSSPASISTSYSDYDPALRSESGPGSFSEGAGNENVDPQFVSTTDLHLRGSSPLLDAGGPLDSSPPTESALDLDGNNRTVDGNGDGTATSDMGAFEYQRRPPAVSFDLSPNPAHLAQPVSFNASVTDPDPGDTFTYSWSFDDGATASGRAPTHAFQTLGQHAATVTVTDSGGLTATASQSVTVAAEPVAVSSLSLTNRVFAVGPQPTATVARRKPKRGTTFRFALSAPGTVTIEIQRALPGRKKGKRCTAQTRRTRRAKRCTRYQRRGMLVRTGVAGVNRVPFSGRIGTKPLPPGRYRAIVSARQGQGPMVRGRSVSFAIVVPRARR